MGLAGGLAIPIVKYIMPEIPRAHPYPQTRLVWGDGSPVKASDLEVNKVYLFNYPLHSTLNFLINLGNERGSL
ncbi:MAG: hypothetical protein P3X22_006210 [Thermoprotei archaeon]|nr:hypothetical protein [Thermoprotei archaeon]